MTSRQLLTGFLSVSSMALALLLSGCSSLPGVHKIDVNQGNVITQEMVNQLRPGMSRIQARYVLGSPMLESLFHEDRWDYLYRRHPGGKDAAQQRVTLYFDQDRLTRVEGDIRPRKTDPLDGKPVTRVDVPLKAVDQRDAYEQLLDAFGLDGG